ncbi:LEAF RUST 10 DISEASE-RESISTANCE LOCUS RECEPTOR-LIKE PROTEIN KINASE-like 1.2 [Phragmites australis]|uniref:LEAF RUST 10 DISEASE-RESISTANCE LOCUS RECEPTOR-LIKE PROTEIN KINASE-like 1.2 n=1 Tax=Phragmites australis TaxID=29695 RepID=UPI002D7A314B|nr:LEAF RUST 10 DISEASE-RESISTANCE LOCUS RECEPTOR-LIKE PROTEIN KINASE-like 1.2 [Phragmites australis]
MALGLLSVISTSLLHLAIATSNGTSKTSCTPARCGDLTITYPFSIGGEQPPYCGYQAFELTCDGDRAYLTRAFKEHLFHVDNISYENNSLMVAVEATLAGDETCHIPDFNVSSSLALFLVNISGTNKNLVFVDNCEVPLPHRVQRPPPCANHTIGAYISERPDGEGKPPHWVPTNCSSVSMPVRGFHDGMEPARAYDRLISDGILLEWPTLGDCVARKRNGGECRFVELSFKSSLESLPLVLIRYFLPGRSLVTFVRPSIGIFPSSELWSFRAQCCLVL